MELHKVAIDENEHIFLDGKEIQNVTAYNLKNSAGETAELTVTMYVTVGQVAAESNV